MSITYIGMSAFIVHSRVVKPLIHESLEAKQQRRKINSNAFDSECSQLKKKLIKSILIKRKEHNEIIKIIVGELSIFATF